jgi:uncharacterized membrane protein YraQ (UPF0718 family)
MKALNILKKNKLLVLVALVYGIFFMAAPQTAMKSVGNSVYYLVEMLQVLPVIFLLTVVIEAWVPKELIMRGFGEKSGFKGNLLSLLLGSISAGPIYAAFPISKSLLSKGASVRNIVIILSSWAVIKVPMLANEAKFLGVDFMIVRWILTVICIFVMAYLTAIVVKKKDMPGIALNKQMDVFSVKEEYCIGCGLCAEILPDYYEMKNNKACVKASPDNKEAVKAVMESAQKCPTKAIIFEKAMKGEIS